MKIEWLVTDVTPVGSLDRAERDILVMTLDAFCPVQAAIVIGEPLCDLGFPC